MQNPDPAPQLYENLSPLTCNQFIMPLHSAAHQPAHANELSMRWL